MNSHRTTASPWKVQLLISEKAHKRWRAEQLFLQLQKYVYIIQQPLQARQVTRADQGRQSCLTILQKNGTKGKVKEKYAWERWFPTDERNLKIWLEHGRVWYWPNNFARLNDQQNGWTPQGPEQNQVSQKVWLVPWETGANSGEDT